MNTSISSALNVRDLLHWRKIFLILSIDLFGDKIKYTNLIKEVISSINVES
jgi:hypothetical protein